MSSFTYEHHRNITWILPIAVVLGFLVLARIVVGVAYANRIYPGVQVAGVDLGGQTVDQAAATLAARFQTVDQPMAVQAGDQTLTLKPSQLGFQPQARSLARATFDVGRTSEPKDVLAGPFLAFQTTPVVTPGSLVDDAALNDAVTRLAGQIDRAPKDATLQFTPSMQLDPGYTGRALNQAQAKEAIRLYFLTSLLKSGAGPLSLPVETRQQAVTAAQLQPVQAQAEKILGQQIVLTDGQQSWPIPAATLQSAFAVEGTPPSLAIKPDALGGLVQGIAQQIQKPARDARLVITQGRVLIDEDAPGLTLDQNATLAAIQQKVLAGDTQIAVVSAPLAPAVTAKDLQKPSQDAQALIDKGLVLKADGQSYPVSASDLGDMLVVTQDLPGSWTVSLDQAKLAAAISRINQQFRRPNQDARFDWQNGKVQVLSPQVPGEAIDEKAAVSKVLEGWHTGQVDLPVVQTKITIDQAFIDRLNADLKGIIAVRSISYVGSIPERAHNINLALSKINGTLVMPGQTFSFNRALGPPTLAAGFEWGFAYSTSGSGQSQVVPSVAGGICQVATSVFQPVFWSGYEIDERHWHMFAMHSYADKGYLGLDATVDPTSGVDFQFTNDSDHALLIKSWGDGVETNVELISTKPNWTVKVAPEVITDLVPAPSKPVRSTSPMFAAGRTIVLEAPGEGLTTHDTRQVTYPDGHVRTLNLTSQYDPAPLSILVGTG